MIQTLTAYKPFFWLNYYSLNQKKLKLLFQLGYSERQWDTVEMLIFYNSKLWIFALIIFRPIKGICGLSQEAVIGLVANLESRELRRVEYQEKGLPPEHPRASATDDVEGIIALMHEMLGDIFDVKQFLEAQPKILNEFKKRIDPEF